MQEQKQKKLILEWHSIFRDLKRNLHIILMSMLIGLMGSALVNIAFSFCPYFPLLLALWFMNGALQSLLWTPIVRILAVHFRDETRNSAAFFLSISSSSFGSMNST